MFRVLFFVGFAFLASAADNLCAPWDDQIDDLVLDPIISQVNESTGGFISIPDYKEDFGYGTHLKTLGGILGNLTTIKLYKTTGESAVMCQDGSNITVGLHVGLTDLETTFTDFQIKLPLLPVIGDTKTTIKNTGNGIALSLSLISNGPSCDASLNYLNILDYGETTVHFENGTFNKLYQTLITHLYRPLVKILRTFSILEKIEKAVETLAARVVTQEGEKICKILSELI